MDYDTTFSGSFAVYGKDSAEGPDVVFITEGVSRLAPALAIEVKTQASSTWRGEFFGGRQPFTHLANAPDPDVLVVVAGGVGCIVPVLRPTGYEVVALRPITQVLPAPSSRVLVVSGFTRLVGIGGRPSRVLWETSRLVDDAFEEVRVAGSVVVVRGRTLSGGEVRRPLMPHLGRLLPPSSNIPQPAPPQ